jgi:hypothetical protein
LQEREKEANEAAANTTKTIRGEECTIRTNSCSAPQHDLVINGAGGGAGSKGGNPGGGSLSETCETCSQQNKNSTSRDAGLQNAGLRGSTSGHTLKGMYFLK